MRTQVIFGEAFFSGERQQYPSKDEERNQTWFYRTIRALEEHGDPAQFARLERAIKDDEDRYDVLFWLYVYASVDTMRAPRTMTSS